MARVQSIDYSVNVLRALLWQYNRATRLESILTQKQAWYDTNVTGFWTDWVRDVFDLRTANEFGCQVWARILGIKLAVGTAPTDPGSPAFAYGPLRENYERGNFGQASSGAIYLTLEQQRLVLRLRYFQLITRCTVPEINRFMSVLFADYGPVWVEDALDMSEIVYVFGFALSPDLRLIFEQFDLLPRPATVGIRVTEVVYPLPGDYLLDEKFNYLTTEVIDDRLTA